MRCRPRRDEGFALITALWAALILAVMVSLIVKAARTDAHIARNTARMAELNAVADAGLAATELRLLAPDRSRSIWVEGSPFQETYAGRKMQISLQDQAGLIDINTAGRDFLIRVFQGVAALDESAAEGLADKVMDWREKGMGKRLQGAKADDYAANGLRYAPREGPFQTVSELSLVIGLTPAVFRKIESCITIYSQKPFVDPEVAPEAVLAVLPGMSADQAAMQISERQRRHLSGELDPSQLLPLVGRSFRITATLVEADGLIVAKSTVVRVTGDAAQPFWFYSN